MVGSPFSRAVRAAALLASMALVGGLIGMGWEQAIDTQAEAPDPEPLTQSEEPLKPAGPRQRSSEEEAILQRVLSHFPPYPRGSRPEVLAADYLGAKVPIAAVWLATEDSPDEVLEHYRQVLEEKGLPPIGQRYNPHAGFVGYWDPESEEVFLVSTLAQGGETLVFVSVAQVAALVEDSKFVPEWFPLPPRLEEPMALSLSLEGVKQHTASGFIPVSSLGVSADSYRALLVAQGWTVAAERQPHVNEVELDIHRDQVQGTALLKHTPMSPRVHLFLSLRERP
jgi:hypothetical protein